MAIPASLEQTAPGAPPRSALARLYLEHERAMIGGGTLAAFLLLWEAFGRSGLVDPLFISSPTRVAQAGYGPDAGPRFLERSRGQREEFILGYGLAVAIAIPLGLAIGCPSGCNTCSVRSSTRSTRCRASRCCR